MGRSTKGLKAVLARGVLALAVILVGAPLFGAGCEPGCITTVPQCGVQCRGGQVLVCINTCETPVGDGQPCSPNPCVAGNTAAGSPNGSCADDETCLPDKKCHQFDEGPGQVCDPALDFCSNDLFCRDPVACGIVNPMNPNPNLKKPRCAFTRPQDMTCDGDWSPAPRITGTGATPPCNLCEPGTNCIAGFCHERCAKDSDCPCNGGYACPSSAPMGSSGSLSANHCYTCMSFGQSCSDLNPCCDGSSCASGVCCSSTVGQACTSASECCGALVCVPNATGPGMSCQPCVSQNNFCNAEAECCPGLDCIGASCICSGKGQCCGPQNGNERCCDGLNCVDGGAMGTGCSGLMICDPPGSDAGLVADAGEGTDGGKDCGDDEHEGEHCGRPPRR